MLNEDIDFIAQRMSLRPPQREGLEILAKLTQILPLTKNQNLTEALEKVKADFPQFEDFERDFPSFCFALATGVGKTRLMGAFIAYLVRQKKSRHFLILAPNLTIYKKLINDFTFSHAKYVLTGMPEFAHTPPEIITGDNYETGIGVRPNLLDWHENIHINIFNIAKINSEMRGDKVPRIKRLQETIGESYFDYLRGLEDLVLLMDEAHHYRASAGAKAINELKPIIGLELTATPQVESGKNNKRFKNIVQDYPLAKALKDGFVKSPAVVTRTNFNKSNYADEKQLEIIKLQDGITLHEEAREALSQYAYQKNQPIIKPFMLIITRDQNHAAELEALIKSNDFFDGFYADKTIQVHSGQKGKERDEIIERLLAVESPDEPTEIVIHVNMLKEGWDVTNLYTIVPLRSAHSRTLVEQSVGRGLRLPYGRRTGNDAVDRLNIVAHDHFEAIIAEAQKPDSIFKYIERRELPENGEPVMRKETIEVKPQIQTELPEKFPNQIEYEIADAIVQTITETKFENPQELTKADMQEKIIQRTKSRYLPSKQEFSSENISVEKIAQTVATFYQEKTIDIPRIIVLPKDGREGGYHFKNFDLNIEPLENIQPVPAEVLIEYLENQERQTIAPIQGIKEEEFENLIINKLISGYPDISYDETADLLHKLARQAITALENRLKEKDKVQNVVHYHAMRIAEIIHNQMNEHCEEAVGEVEIIVKGFEKLRPARYEIEKNARFLDYKKEPPKKNDIKKEIFSGFKKCLYDRQRFESNAERLFAFALEKETQNLKWIKPAPNQINIEYKLHHRLHKYNPDFIVETEKQKLICEIKRASEIDSVEVQAKKNAAVEWCQWASDHEKKYKGKQWLYLLIPDDAITKTSTLEGLISQYKEK